MILGKLHKKLQILAVTQESPEENLDEAKNVAIRLTQLPCSDNLCYRMTEDQGANQFARVVNAVQLRKPYRDN